MAIKYTEKYFTTAQAAELLGVDTDTVKRYCNCDPPRLSAEKVGTIWMIPESELKRYRKEESERGRPKNVSR